MGKNHIVESSTRMAPVSKLLLLYSIMMVVLGLAVPCLFTKIISGALSLNVLLPFTVILWSVSRLAFTGIQGGRRLTLMCFYVFNYVFFGVQPFLSIWNGEFPNQISLSQSVVAITGFLILIGILAFELGYRLLHVTIKSVNRSIPLETRSISIKKIWYAIMLVVGLVVFIMITYGPGIFLTPRSLISESFEINELSLSTWLLVTDGVRVPAAVLLILVVYVWKARRYLEIRKTRLTLLKTALFVLVVLNLVVSNPINAARFWVGSVSLAILIILLPWRGARSYLLWATFACLGLLLLFSGLDPRFIFSQSLNNGDQVSLSSTINTVSESIRNLPMDLNFDAYAMFASTINYANENGYRWGRQLLLPAFFWVPRSFWSGKPEGTPRMVASPLGLHSLNVGCPLWAEGYVNFGVSGVILFLFVFGLLAGTVDDFLVRTTNQISRSFPTLASVFFVGNTFILLRGDLTTGTMYLQFVILVSLLLCKGTQIR